MSLWAFKRAFTVHCITHKGSPFRTLSQDTQNLNLKHCCLETQTLTMWTILHVYRLCMITLKIQKGFSTIYLLIYNVYYFSKYCINLQNSWYVSVLVMCECVCYCAYFINVNKLHLHVCVLERAKHLFCSAQSFVMFCHEYNMFKPRAYG